MDREVRVMLCLSTCMTVALVNNEFGRLNIVCFSCALYSTLFICPIVLFYYFLSIRSPRPWCHKYYICWQQKLILSVTCPGDRFY